MPVGGLASAAVFIGGMVAARTVGRRMAARRYAEALRVARAAACTPATYTPAPSDGRPRASLAAGVADLGDIVQTRAGQPPLTLRWFADPEHRFFGCVGVIDRFRVVRVCSTDDSDLHETFATHPVRSSKAPTAPFIHSTRAAYSDHLPDLLTVHRQRISTLPGLRALAAAEEVCTVMTNISARIARWRTEQPAAELLAFDLDRLLIGRAASLRPRITALLSDDVPQARVVR